MGGGRSRPPSLTEPFSRLVAARPYRHRYFPAVSTVLTKSNLILHLCVLAIVRLAVVLSFRMNLGIELENQDLGTPPGAKMTAGGSLHSDFPPVVMLNDERLPVPTSGLFGAQEDAREGKIGCQKE